LSASPSTNTVQDKAKLAVAGIIVVGVGIAARPELPDMSTRLESRAPVLKAGKPVIWTQSDQVTIR